MAIKEMENTPEYQDPFFDNAPKYKIYSIKAFVIATFFGTPLAGGYLIANNYQRLGNKAYARRALIYSLLVVIASLIIGLLLPE